MIVAIFFVTLVTYFTYVYLERKRKFKSLEHLPGPKGYPFIGNVLEYGRNSTDIYKAVKMLPKQYGPLCRLWIGPWKCYLLVSDADFIEFILSSPKHIFKGRDYDNLKPWLSNGLLVSNGTYWQKRRKIITPSFHFKILEEFAQAFATNADVMVQKLEKEVGKRIDIYPYITNFTLDTICETAMGTPVNAQEKSDNEYVKAVRLTTQIVQAKKYSAWKSFEFLYRLSNDYQEQKRCLQVMHDFTRNVIERRRQQLADKGSDGGYMDEFGVKRKVAFLDLLLQARVDEKPLTNEDIREEVDTFMFEGHDTTASALSFAIYELAKNPRVQEQVIKEFKELFGDYKNRELSLNDMNNMKYLEAVIKETLRMYTTVPQISRDLQEDAQFKGLHLPKGLQILISLVGVHYQDKFYKEPDLFYPERFLEQSTNGKVPFCYVPFSAGPRNCIGQKFAMYELKTALFKLLTNYALEYAGTAYDPILGSELILKSANGINVILQKRNP